MRGLSIVNSVQCAHPLVADYRYLNNRLAIMIIVVLFSMDQEMIFFFLIFFLFITFAFFKWTVIIPSDFLIIGIS